MNIAVMALLSGAFQLAAHYLPWRSILRRKLRRTEAYAIGVVLMLAPFSVWLGLAGLWLVLLALWVVVATSGAFVIGAYLLDGYLEKSHEGQVAQAENRVLRGGVFDDANAEARRASLENGMAAVVHASKRLELASLRVRQAAEYGQSAVLSPAMEDLSTAMDKLQAARRELGDLWQMDWGAMR